MDQSAAPQNRSLRNRIVVIAGQNVTLYLDSLRLPAALSHSIRATRAALDAHALTSLVSFVILVSYIKLLPIIRARFAALVGVAGDKDIEGLTMVKVHFNGPFYCEILAKAHHR